MRNPILDGVQYIGDPHLGRQFSNISPEKQAWFSERQWETLRGFFDNQTMPIVIVGDLFDKFTVSDAIKARLLDLLSKTKGEHEIYILMGNHDSSKNTALVSSFDLVKSVVDSWDLPHLYMLKEPMAMLHDQRKLLIPWSATKTAIEMFLDCSASLKHTPDSIVCHLDRLSYGDHESRNMIPFEQLEYHKVSKVINGHEHTPYQGFYGSISYHGTGSMLPYSHAEDPEGTWFRTLTVEQANQADVADLTDKFIRITGDDFSNLDQAKLVGALTVSYKKVESVSDEPEFTVESRSTAAIIKEVAAQLGTPDHIRDKVISELLEQQTDA